MSDSKTLREIEKQWRAERGLDKRLRGQGEQPKQRHRQPLERGEIKRRQERRRAINERRQLRVPLLKSV
jgi:hypothetical protein